MIFEYVRFLLMIKFFVVDKICRQVLLVMFLCYLTFLLDGVATAWTGVNMSTSLFPEVVPEIDANPELQILKLYARALATASSSSALSKQARCDKRDTLHTSCVSCRDATNGIWTKLQ